MGAPGGSVYCGEASGEEEENQQKQFPLQFVFYENLKLKTRLHKLLKKCQMSNLKIFETI